jgi:hypothetical protein
MHKGRVVKVMDFEHVSDEDLARILMRFLWQQYDAGGVSMGRSLRSAMLEIVLWIIPFPRKIKLFEESFLNFSKALVEARSRVKSGVPTQLVFDFGLEHMPDRHFVSLLFDAMVRWYENDQHFHQYPLSSEREILLAICGCLRVSGYMVQFRENGVSYTPEQLRDEGNDRFRAINRMGFDSLGSV